MLSGLKFIPRDQIEKAQDEDLGDSRRETRSSVKKKEKGRGKKKSSRYGSSDEDDLERIAKGSRKKKKWYSSDEHSSYSTENESQSCSDKDEKKGWNRKREKKRYDDGSEDEARDRSKKKLRNRRNNYSSEDHSLSNSEDEDKDGYNGRKDKHRKGSKRYGRKKRSERGGEIELMGDDLTDDGSGSHPLDNSNNIVRKEMGLEWMLRPKDSLERKPATTSDQPEEPQAEEMKKENPRELNPYLKNNGTGYPEPADGTKAGRNQLLSSAVVGDGGASWRLKALKRSQEQAAREGRAVKEVVQERWGSLGQLAVSVASRTAAPSRAHLHAINNRKKGLTEEQQKVEDDQDEKVTEKNIGQESLQNMSRRHPNMKVPKLRDSLSWGKRKSQIMSSTDSGIISTALSSLNKFANDGSFMREITRQQKDDTGGSLGSSYSCERVESESVVLESQKASECAVNQGLSANQLAAKALQLRLKGKHEEAEKLLKEAENMKAKQVTLDESNRRQNERNSTRPIIHGSSLQQKKKEEDADIHLAQKIVQNKQYSMSAQADDEYDFDDGPRKKTRKKGAWDHKSTEKVNFPKRILTQQERCKFCFENPNRPKHLVVAIANFTYLSLPHWQSVVPGHCCILTLQHESSTRAVDNNVWDEIRNFKKCLIMMFAKQEKDVVFLETVMGLAQQRRHCLVECIPLPQNIAKQAPLYFKKAIDEAEDEWSQHNSKKLIDTSEKGLRGSIPKDFPYFHVEFGLNKGFVHVIDDEQQFKSNFGLNVVRGMLKLPEEDSYGRRKQDSVESQNQAVGSFSQNWGPFDWTKQLD
ncbi:CwfJ-like family protein [Actinidia rufa]|uniref:CwfJ-like family protein n=1 Tax=Actinidia rufa TaxID=165716 RepID=A0A7J0GMY9_9ERIC|nr:CwfJ-like family protein [Actinidia rufa]